MKHLFGQAKKIKGRMTIVASDETLDRDGEVLEMDKWDFGNFRKNPVMLWSHDYRSKPIGKVRNLKIENEKLKFEPEFAATNEGQEVKYLFEEGFLNSVSVGYDTKQKEIEGIKKTIRELLEISAVPIPANPNALVEMRSKGYKFRIEREDKSAIPYSIHGDGPKAAEDVSWDAGREVKKASVEQLKKMSAWFDSENPDVKGSYKLPHHTAEGNKVVRQGVIAAGNALMGARGGVDLPANDVKGVQAHLAKEYKRFDLTPPWEKSKTVIDDQGERAKKVEKVVKLWEDHKPKMKLMRKYFLVDLRKLLKVPVVEDEIKQIELVYKKLNKALSKKSENLTSENLSPEIDKKLDEIVESVISKKTKEYPVIKKLLEE